MESLPLPRQTNTPSLKTLCVLLSAPLKLNDTNMRIEDENKMKKKNKLNNSKISC